MFVVLNHRGERWTPQNFPTWDKANDWVRSNRATIGNLVWEIKQEIGQ